MKTGLPRHFAVKFWPTRICRRSTSNASCKDILRWPHGVDELACDHTNKRCPDEASTGGAKIQPRPPISMVDGQAIGTEIQSPFWARCCGHRCIFSPSSRAEVLRRELCNRGDRWFIRVMPDISARDLGTRGELSLGNVRLAREGGLTSNIVVHMPPVCEPICLVGIACMTQH